MSRVCRTYSATRSKEKICNSCRPRRAFSHHFFCSSGRLKPTPTICIHNSLCSCSSAAPIGTSSLSDCFSSSPIFATTTVVFDIRNYDNRWHACQSILKQAAPDPPETGLAFSHRLQQRDRYHAKSLSLLPLFAPG